MKKRKPAKRARKEVPISPNLILDKRRIVTLIGEVDEELSKKAIKELIKLDYLSNKPITILINYPGVDCTEGLAIIVAMKMCNSPVNTIVTGMCASMAGIISVCGDIRVITKNAFWMAHPMAGGTYDYKQHLIDYVDFIKVLDVKMSAILSTHTKLTKEDVEKFKHGQLWLDAKQCIEKGVCDEIINEEGYNHRLPHTFKKSRRKRK